MACLLGLPSVPLGWNVSNSALRSLVGLVVGQRLGTDLHRRRGAAADDHHRFRVAAEGLPEDVGHLRDLDRARRAAAGIDTVVPPLKSMPKVNPRNRMLTIATATIAPLMPYHSRRRPTTSNAPVPV